MSKPNVSKDALLGTQTPQSAASGLISPRTIENNSKSLARPEPTALQPGGKKKRNHRGGKKKRARKQSFAVSTEDGSDMPGTSNAEDVSRVMARETLYRLQGRNLSNTSLESEALLDHRCANWLSDCFRH
jgi:magnesium transporter